MLDLFTLLISRENAFSYCRIIESINANVVYASLWRRRNYPWLLAGLPGFSKFLELHRSEANLDSANDDK